MSAFLFPTLPFGPDELPTSFVSRLARLHRAPSAPAFCREVGLRLQLISDGDPDALAHLADLTGAPLERLTANTIRRVSAHVLTYRTEKLRKSCLYQRAQRICPSCLAEDCRRRPDLGELAGYGRSIWRLAVLRTCPIHRTTLTNLPYETLERGLKFVRHDFCTLLTAAGIDPRTGPEAHAETEPSSLERYLQQRLAGTEAEIRWLDHLPYYGVVKSCEIFGCVDRFGPKQILNDLDEDAWHIAGAAGFDILVQGPAGIRSFLQDLRERHRADRNRSRYAIYGPLYRWLRFEENEPVFEELRNILTEHFICDVGPGSSRGIFGSNLPRRGISTIFSAAKDYRIDHRKLRRILAMNGLIAADHADHTADRVTFDLAAADPLLRDIATGLSLSAVASYLETDRRDVVDLVATGLLRPLFHGGKRGSLLQIYIFRKADVEALMARLYTCVGSPAPTEAQVHDLPGASHRARCSKFEIVELIASGKLTWVGARPGATTLNALLVDLNEVRRHLHAAFSDVVLVSEAAKILGVGTPDVRALVAQGLLRSAPLRHPRTRVLHDGIERASLKRFGKRYISSLRAAEQYKSKARHVMAAAAAHKIEIKFKCVRKNFAVYLRKDIRKIYSAKDRPFSGSRSARTQLSASPTMRAPPGDGVPRESD